MSTRAPRSAAPHASEQVPHRRGLLATMPLQFHRVVEKLEIWSANSERYSFVISHESPAGPGFHGRAGYMASWRPVAAGGGAIRIAGSPFKTFDEAEAACNAMLKHLMTR